MPTIYNARDANNYERLMGRWSRRLAPLFIEHAGTADGEEVLEVGCGTGSLTFALADATNFLRLTAIDQSAVYLSRGSGQESRPTHPFRARRRVHAAFLRRQFRPVFVDARAAYGGAAPRADGRRNAPRDPAGRHCRMFWDTAAALDGSAATARDST